MRRALRPRRTAARRAAPPGCAAVVSDVPPRCTALWRPRRRVARPSCWMRRAGARPLCRPRFRAYGRRAGRAAPPGAYGPLGRAPPGPMVDGPAAPPGPWAHARDAAQADEPAAVSGARDAPVGRARRPVHVVVPDAPPTSHGRRRARRPGTRSMCRPRHRGDRPDCRPPCRTCGRACSPSAGAGGRGARTGRWCGGGVTPGSFRPWPRVPGGPVPASGRGRRRTPRRSPRRRGGRGR